jgi:hypothetical protein
MYSRQAARSFEVFDDVSMVPRVADLRDSEESDQLIFCHYGGAEIEFTVWARQDGCGFDVLLRVVHG